MTCFEGKQGATRQTAVHATLWTSLPVAFLAMSWSEAPADPPKSPPGAAPFAVRPALPRPPIPQPPGVRPVPPSSSSVSIVVGPRWRGWWRYPRGPWYCDPSYSWSGYPYPYPYTAYPLGPLYIPAENLYGPQAVRRFMDGGLSSTYVEPTWGGLPGWTNRGGEGGNLQNDGGAAADTRNGRPVVPRATNPDAVARAKKFLASGDVHFGHRKFSDALQRYRSAASAAPMSADGYLRQGFAYAALAKYEQAAKAFRRGLDLDPAWPASGFALDDLYAGNGPTKAEHLAALTKAADAAEDGDVLFVLGIYSYCDGQPGLAAKFLAAAVRVNPANAPYLQGFTRNVAPAAPNRQVDF